MAIYKRSRIYWYKLMWNGETIRESTKQGNDRKARNIESAHRASLANGLVGIRDRKPVPTLADFLKNDFLPFAETKHAAKPLTFRYYKQGGTCLLNPLSAPCALMRLPTSRRKNSPANVRSFPRAESTADCGRCAAPSILPSFGENWRNPANSHSPRASTRGIASRLKRKLRSI